MLRSPTYGTNIFDSTISGGLVLRECGNCGVKENLHVHHIVPRGLGGTERATNKVTLCVDCHAKVHGRDAGYAEAVKRGLAKARAEGRMYVPPLKVTPEAKEKIKSLLESGHTIKEISLTIGLCHASINKAKRELGIRSIKLSQEEIDQIKTLSLNGFLVKDIAKQLGITRVTISKVKKKLGLPQQGTAGRQLSPEHRAKISVSLNKPGVQEKRTASFRGMRLSLEHRRKIGDGVRNFHNEIRKTQIDLL